jgi:hypothetical protein
MEKILIECDSCKKQTTNLDQDSWSEIVYRWNDKSRGERSISYDVCSAICYVNILKKCVDQSYQHENVFIADNSVLFTTSLLFLLNKKEEPIKKPEPKVVSSEIIKQLKENPEKVIKKLDRELSWSRSGRLIRVDKPNGNFYHRKPTEEEIILKQKGLPLSNEKRKKSIDMEFRTLEVSSEPINIHKSKEEKEVVKSSVYIENIFTEDRKQWLENYMREIITISSMEEMEKVWSQDRRWNSGLVDKLQMPSIPLLRYMDKYVCFVHKTKHYNFIQVVKNHGSLTTSSYRIGDLKSVLIKN